MKRIMRAAAVFGWVMAAGLAWAAETAADKPRNIILFIGDGMGMNHVQAGSMQKAMLEKQPPLAVRLSFETFPVTGYLTTYAANQAVTDSAAAGTALACGVKANNGMIGKSADGRDAESSAAVAKRTGRAVGILTSVALDDATPAVFYAHAGSRRELDSILDQAFASTAYDVLIGSGVMTKGWTFAKLQEKAAGEGLCFVNAGNLAALSAETAAGKRVFGCFSLNGDTTPALAASHKADNPELRLTDVTRKALEILCSRAGEKGFFLMVEGGAIDKFSHKNNTAGMLGELLEFDRTIADTVEFLRSRGELDRTLIVVTADHETGGLVLAERPALIPSAPAAPAPAAAPGAVTAPGEIMMPPAAPKTAGPVMSWTFGSHTCSWVPVFATGPAAGRFAGRHDNTEIAITMKALLQP